MGIGTIVRTILLVMVWVNQALALNGISPIPVDEVTISTVITGIVSLVAWWKNNNFTKEAKWGQEKTNKYKAQKKMAKATGYAPVTEEPVDGLQNK